MSGDERRFFSGAGLAQALMAASRHYHLLPEELAYRVREKRHGFTHKARAMVIEIDPAAPRRLGGSGEGAATAPAVSVPAAPARQAKPALTERPERSERPARSARPRERAEPARREGRTAVARPSEEHLFRPGRPPRALRD